MKNLISVSLAAAALLATPLAANALVYQFNADINSTQEVPTNSTTGNGVATLFYNDRNTALTTDDSYDFALSVFGLTGPALDYHIHAPAPVGVNAPVVVSLRNAPFVSLAGSNSLLVGGSDVAPPYAMFLSQLQSSSAYVNIHTAAFPGGEIRGQLIQVAVIPEPSTYALLAAGLGVVGLLARRKARSAA